MKIKINKILKPYICMFGLLFVGMLVLSANRVSPPYNENPPYNLDQIAPKAEAISTKFISSWRTDSVSSDSSGVNQTRLPLVANGTYNFTVNWGDGRTDIIISWNQNEVTHTYSSSGIYTIQINGTIVGWSFNGKGDRRKIISISQWGCLRLGNEGGYFAGCDLLEISATDVLNLTGTTNFSYMFSQCSLFMLELNNWDVSSATNMSGMFYSASNMNAALESWNVSNVEDMSNMFNNVDIFSQPLDEWDVSSVMNMSGMFQEARDFNQPLGSWDVSHVRDMSYMFFKALDFNQPLNNWNVSNVLDMSYMFAGHFNQPLNNWDVSKVKNMSGMFGNANYFNQPLGSWDVSQVENMMYMFAFTAFNQPLANWNVSKVKNMEYMFSGASNFNRPLGSWDVSQVEDMKHMFEYNMVFDRPLGDWNVSNVKNMSSMFFGCELSTANYDQILLGWSKLTLQNGVPFDAGKSKYSSDAASARQLIIDTYNWDIQDGGKKITISGYPIGLLTSLLLTLTGIFILRKMKKITQKEWNLYYS